MSQNSYGIDLVTLDGDLILTDAGDFLTTTDYQNSVDPDGTKFDGYYGIVFSVFNRLNTIQGEIPFHPEYGTGLQLLVSKPNNDATAEQIKQAFYQVLEQDPRIQDIISVIVEQQGSQANVKAELLLTGKAESSIFIFPNFFIE